MSKSKVVTLRMPVELKRRLEREAKYQGNFRESVEQLFAEYSVNPNGSHFISGKPVVAKIPS